jgi:hypothetical protein
LPLCCEKGGVLSAPYLCGGWLSRLGLVALVFARLSARPCSPLLLAFLGTDHIDIHFKILRFLEGTSVADPYVCGPPEYRSGSISQRYGSGSFCHQAKIVTKALIPAVL